MSGSTSTGSFATTNGQIIGPNGSPFVARGVAVIEGNQPSVSTLLSDFPGINFVRLAIYDYPSPDSLAAYVNSLTSQGIVVELEDHNNGAGNAGGGEGSVFTGSQLTNELNWYSSIASAFKNNPDVWFGTDNEPPDNPSAAALSTWQQQTYQAIRNTGNNNPVMMELIGGGDPGLVGAGNGMTASTYASMTNIIWDLHYYGWVAGFSTDQNTVTQGLNSLVSAAQTITSANGTVPVLIGEYGDSTTGTSRDPNANQVLSAVQHSGLGSAAWAWGAGNPSDGLSDGGTGLSGYGQEVAAWIAAAAAASPPAPAPAATPSVNDTAVTGTTSAITDASGNKWTITTGGQVAVNGTADKTTANVIELAYVNGTIWQENSSKLWWGETQPNASWAPAAGTATSPLPNGPIPAPTPTQSLDDTVVRAGSAVAIMDASGNKWTITSTAQVAVNGVTDATTANVTELALVGNEIWQKNASNLWWGKTSPAAAWVPAPDPGISPLPASVTLSATQASATIGASQASVTATSGNHMVFINGSGDTVNLAGGANTITDAGKGNTYVIPAAGKGYDTFTSNILDAGGTLDLRTALAATDWHGTTSTLANYLSVADTSQGAFVSIAPTSGGAGAAIATISGATNATLATLLAHSIT
jgi:Cellulase (glycosyl hydrolase family 5)